MPFLNDAYGIYYNKDMFAPKGVTDVPKTLDEFSAQNALTAGSELAAQLPQLRVEPQLDP